MGITFKTQAGVETDRTEQDLHAELDNLDKQIKSTHSQLRYALTKTIACKKTIRYIDQMGSDAAVKKDPQLQNIVDHICKEKPDCNLHDISCGLENVLTDYAKKVTTFTQTLITSVRQYSVGLFDLFVKKLKINNKINVDKFVAIDSSMRMIVMTYGDYCEIGNPIVDKSANLVSDMQEWFKMLGSVRKALDSGDNDDIKKVVDELTDKIHNGQMISYLKEHNLAEFQFGIGFQNGNEGLIKVDVTKRFNDLETSQILSEAGWTDVEQLKGALILKHADEVSKNISAMYKNAVDLMDEVRRISNDFCVKDPYVCAVLVKYASLIAQMVNVYTKAFDMCWTTCLRVSQACLVEG